VLNKAKMNRELNINLTPGLVRKSIFYQFRNLLIALVFLIISISISVVFQISHAKQIDWINLLIPILPVFALLVILPIMAYQKTMNQIRKMNSSVVNYRITDDWLYVQSELASGQNSWEVFKKIRKYPKIWHLVLQSGGVLIFPVEQLDEELKRFLLEKLPSESAFSNQTFKVLVGWLMAFVIVMYFARQFNRPNPTLYPPSTISTPAQK
jgi:hypothetical protein